MGPRPRLRRPWSGRRGSPACARSVPTAPTLQAPTPTHPARGTGLPRVPEPGHPHLDDRVHQGSHRIDTGFAPGSFAASPPRPPRLRPRARVAARGKSAAFRAAIPRENAPRRALASREALETVIFDTYRTGQAAVFCVPFFSLAFPFFRVVFSVRHARARARRAGEATPIDAASSAPHSALQTQTPTQTMPAPQEPYW